MPTMYSQVKITTHGKKLDEMPEYNNTNIHAQTCKTTLLNTQYGFVIIPPVRCCIQQCNVGLLLMTVNFKYLPCKLHRRFPPEKSAKKIVFFHGNFAMGLSQWVLGVG